MSNCFCHHQPRRFLGSELPLRAAEDCRYHIISVPYEDNVSYGGGTSLGPAAVIEASDQLEAWDGESIPGEDGIFTGLSEVQFQGSTAGAVPEPATWAMLLAGFGLVGAVRRRQRLAQVSA